MIETRRVKYQSMICTNMIYNMKERSAKECHNITKAWNLLPSKYNSITKHRPYLSSFPLFCLHFPLLLRLPPLIPQNFPPYPSLVEVQGRRAKSKENNMNKVTSQIK